MFDVKQVLEREAELAAFCAALDPSSIRLHDVAQVYESFARMERLVTGAKLRLAARVDASNRLFALRWGAAGS
jgi:hypothetical protein